MNLNKGLICALGISLVAGGFWDINKANKAEIAYSRALFSSQDLTKIEGIERLLRNEKWIEESISKDLKVERNRLLSNPSIKMRYDFAEKIRPKYLMLRYFGDMVAEAIGMTILIGAYNNLIRKKQNRQ